MRATNGAGLASTAVSDGVALATPATHFVVSGVASRVRVGELLSATVEARDGTDALVLGYEGTVHFSATDGAAQLPADYTFLVQDGGRRTFASQLRFQTTGTHDLTATDTAIPTLTGQQGGIVVLPAGHPLIVHDANLAAAVGLPYAYNAVKAIRASGEAPLLYSKCGGPAELVVDAVSGEVRWTPAAPGPVSLCVQATNAIDFDSYSFDVQVAPTASSEPVARLAVTPTQGPAPLTVQFDGTRLYGHRAARLPLGSGR